MKASADRQRGVNFVGFVMILAGILFVVILGIKTVPAYMHSMQIAQILKTIATEPGMRDAPAKVIRDSFSKRADINYISDINADDIDINKTDGQLILSASYSVKIPLVGNATLVLDFNPSSS
jgi:hypothetical protein